MFSRLGDLVLPYPAVVKPGSATTTVRVLIVLAALAVTTHLVYRAGGGRFGYVHVMYVPVLLAALYFQALGGLLVGIAAGLCIGPLMPLEVERNLPQPVSSWMFRMLFFAGVGTLVGCAFSRLREATERERELAYRASWTGLLNAAALERDMRTRVTTMPPGSAVTLMLARINNLPDVVNTLGSRTAGVLASRCAERLQRVNGSASTVYDMNQGDLAIVVDCQSGREPPAVQQVKDLTTEPIEVNGLPIYTDISVGTTRVRHRDDPADAIRRAYVALHSAIQAGTVHRDYAPASDSRERNHVQLLTEFAQALRDDQLIVHYQPKIDLQRNSVVGVEALIRWQHPTDGLLSPATFIPLVERTALIHPMTRYVITKVVEDAVRWRENGRDLSCAINLSARNLHDPELVPLVTRLMSRFAPSAVAIEFELTETEIIGADEESVAAINTLKRLGARISIDDFGAGYTSLAHFTNLPIDRIKIDRSFIQGMVRDDRLYAIVASLVDMARALNVDVVAEGVEDDGCLQAVRKVGILTAQGYHFARPMAEPELLTWISEAEHRSIPSPFQ